MTTIMMLMIMTIINKKNKLSPVKGIRSGGYFVDNDNDDDTNDDQQKK